MARQSKTKSSPKTTAVHPQSKGTSNKHPSSTQRPPADPAPTAAPLSSQGDLADLALHTARLEKAVSVLRSDMKWVLREIAEASYTPSRRYDLTPEFCKLLDYYKVVLLHSMY